MADESLLSLISPADLAGFNNQVVQSDPFGIAGNSLASWQPNYSYMDATESGLTSFGKAFAQGLLQNYAQNNASKQLSSVINVLPQLSSDPLGTATPEGVDSSPFNLIRGSAYLNKVKRDETVKATQKATLADLFKSVGIEGIKSGTMDPKSAVDLVTTGKLPETGVVDPLANPNSPNYKVNQDLFKIEQTYTDKLLTGAEPQRVMAMNRASTNILDAIKKNNPLAASTAIFEYAKLQDPAGTIREADEMRVSDPGGPLGALAQIHNQITGEGKLTPDAKKAMRELVPMLQENTFTQYNQLRDSYLDAAKQYGANPERIKYIKPTDLSSYLTEAATEQQIPPGMKLQRNKTTGETRIVPQ